MAVGPMLFVVKLQNRDSIPRDVCQNGWVFEADPGDVTTQDAVALKLRTFYDAIGAGGKLSPNVQWDAANLECYDLAGHLDGTPHGSPVNTFALGLTLTPGDSGLPEGVSVCLSYHSLFGARAESGPTAAIPTPEQAIHEGAPATHPGKPRPKARLRGRVFLGPLSADTIEQDAAPLGESRPGGDWCVVIATAALAMIGAPAVWSQWSRRDAAVQPVAGCFVDHSWTYQRDREVVAAIRTSEGSSV
jgi:hypothetical protein